jgi:hypothetical protein
MTFPDRVSQAAQDGIVVGVKWAFAFGLILFVVSYLLNDYSLVRQRALNGQQAFEYLQKQVTASQSAPAPKGP